MMKSKRAPRTDQEDQQQKRIMAKHPELFGPYGQMEAGRICYLLSHLMRTAITEAEFETQLGNLSAFITTAFKKMLWLSRTPHILKNANRTWAVMQTMIAVLVELVRQVEEFEVETMAKPHDKLPDPSEMQNANFPLRHSFLQACAFNREDWPIVISRNKQLVMQRFKFVTENLQLGAEYYRGETKGKSFESKVASGLRDWIDGYRRSNCTGKIAESARRAEKEKQIVDVARPILRDWFPPYWGQRPVEQLPFFRIALALKSFGNLSQEQIIEEFRASYKVGSRRGVGGAPKFNQIRVRIIEEFKRQAPPMMICYAPHKAARKVVASARTKTHVKQSRDH
jgi:hypothetical protein